MKNRILSIDVLRGMTIFFMIIVNTPGSRPNAYAALLHAKWDGCTPTDLVFPFFLFIVGVSMAFSFLKYESGQKSEWIKKVVKRTLLIFLVGLFLNWFPFFHKNVSALRIFGVLQRIALAYGGAGLLIILIRNRKALIGTVVLILLAYWAMLFYGGGADPYGLEGNVVRQLDMWLLGDGHIYHGYGIPFDPEGLLSTLPGVAHVIIGYFIGQCILKYSGDKSQMLKTLIFSGMALFAVGQLWNLVFPINKPLWTSSYVLHTAGLASLFLALLIWIIDVQGWRKWTYPFRVFGLNPLVSYALSSLFISLSIHVLKTGDGHLYSWLYTFIFQHIGGLHFGSLVQALCYTGFIWIFAWLLYRKGKVIKL